MNPNVFSMRARPVIFAGVLCLLPHLTAQDSSQVTSSPAQIDAPTPIRPVKRVAAKPLTPVQSANTIFLDPAHGGTDDGARFPGALEKDIILAFAERLRPLLAAQGFTVVLGRESSNGQPAPDINPALPILTEDQRTEQANRLHPLACLLLHATNGGHGVHLFTSALGSAATPAEPHAIVPWNTAQAASLTESLRLATDLSTAINGSRIPLVLGRASVPPIDSLTCPAVAIELASLANASLTDLAYQDRVATAITSALTFYRGHTETEAARLATEQAAKAAADAAKASVTTVTPAAKPTPRRPKVQVPAPIIRREPEVPSNSEPKPEPPSPAGAPPQ